MNQEHIAETLRKRRYSERTVEAYTMWLGKLEEHFNGRNAVDVSVEDVLNYLEFLRRRSKNLQTLRSAKSALKFFYSEVAPRPDVVASLPSVGRSKPDPYIPTQALVLEVLNTVDSTFFRVIFSCIYGMGLELIDTVGLKVRDVDVKNCAMRIAARRTRKPRLSPIPLAVQKDILSLVVGRKGNESLFVDQQGKVIRDQKLQRVWAQARDHCGAPKELTCRTLRHAYVNHLQRLGVQIGDIVSHLGYNKSSSFEYYCKASVEVPKIFSPLDRLIDGPLGKVKGDIRYVDEARIRSLMEIDVGVFDFGKLIHLLREIDIASQNGCVYSVVFLVRAVVDHIPPALGQANFNGVVSNYGGSKSFRKAMDHLLGALKNIADAHIHTQLRSSEDIPTNIQVDFRSQLDLLLGEVIRVAGKGRKAEINSNSCAIRDR